VALTTYSVKPRGGVVHTLELADVLKDAGIDVTVIAMAEVGSTFFREVNVPVRLIESPPWQDSLEGRVFSWIDAMTAGLEKMRDDFDIIHSQDCISARAAARIRDAGAPIKLIRTVHHVDDFKTQALIDCQRNAITEPDQVLVVSKWWQRRIQQEYDVTASIVTNGVRSDRFSIPLSSDRRSEIRRRMGVENCFLYLTVGGIEPRKGSLFLMQALSRLKKQLPDPPVLAIVGGHSFQDFNDYRQMVLDSLPELELELDKDVKLLGTVKENELPEFFAAADGFVFPSLNEGWGLVILEAASAGLPVVVSDIDVFQEFLTHGVDALLTRAGDPDSLAKGMARLIDEPEMVQQLSAGGFSLAARYPWNATAAQHISIYKAEGNDPANVSAH